MKNLEEANVNQTMSRESGRVREERGVKRARENQEPGGCTVKRLSSIGNRNG